MKTKFGDLAKCRQSKGQFMTAAETLHQNIEAVDIKWNPPQFHLLIERNRNIGLFHSDDDTH
jgi:hypothetical protein